VNVSLPKIAAPAMPSNPLPGAPTISTKFSIALAQAQDTADPSTADVRNDSEQQVSKKISAKAGKSSDKPTSTHAAPTLPKAISANNSAAPDGKAALTNAMLPFGPAGLQTGVSQTDDSEATDDSLTTAQADSDSPRMFPPQSVLTDSSVVAGPIAGAKSAGDASMLPLVSGVVTSGPPESKPTDSSDPAADNQHTALSSTNLLAAWMGPAEDTTFKSDVALPAVNLEASATPNGKPATAGPKTVSSDAARGTTFALDAKMQTGFTSLQSHAAPSAAPKPGEQPSSNSETKSDALQGHALSGTSMGKQEKAATRVIADAQNQDLDSASDVSTALGKANSPSSGAALGSSGAQTGATAAADTAGSVVSVQQLSPSVVETQAGSPAAVPAASTAPHSQSMAGTEDAEAVAEAAALPDNSPLHAAKLVAGMEQSELRVGWRAGEFGNVDIRTSLVRNQFTAEISVERGDLGRVLAADLPNLQHRLTEQHLSAANITVQDHSGSGSREFQQGSQREQGTSPVGVFEHRVREDSSLPVLPVEAMEATARLDIHM
jgi:hypothetical protein